MKKLRGRRRRRRSFGKTDEGAWVNITQAYEEKY
jgi:hypothetical protein